MPDDLAPGFAVTLPANPALLRDVRSSLRSWLTDEGVPPLVMTDIVLAVDEAVANSVEHAVRPVPQEPVRCSVVAFARSHEVSVTVTDNGRWQAPEHNGIRGRGIPLMVAIMTTVDIETASNGTTIRMNRTF